MKTSASLFLTDILPAKRGLVNAFIKNDVFGKKDRRQVFSQMKKAGIEGIELFLPYYSKVTYEDIREVKKIMDENGMPVLSLHQKIRIMTKTKIQEITELFNMADILSAKVIVLHISTAGKQVFDKEYIETLHSLQKKYGIKIGFENREKFIGSLREKHSWDELEFPTLMKETDFSITLDTTHLAQAGGDIIRFFKRNKERIVNIHLSDYKSHYLNSSLRPMRYKHLPIGKGELPLEEFIKILKKEKYNGLLTMEMHADLKGICDGAKVISNIKKEAN